MRALYLIPARSGSKGIPDKNIKELNGKPLIFYTLDVAKDLADTRDICVSTDSEKYRKIVEDCGVSIPFLRPSELSSDTATSYDVILHAIEFYKSQHIHYDAVVLLQPTSPLRSSENIKKALSFFSDDIDMVVSVKETKSNPYYTLYTADERGFLKKISDSKFTRRQDVPKIYELNGAVYIINTNSLIKHSSIADFKKVKLYEMNELQSVDVDTELDWLFCEYLLKKI